MDLNVYHKLIICRNWKARDKRKMLVKVTFVQVRVLLLLGSENYSGKKISYVSDLSMSLNCLLWLDGGIGRHNGLN